MQGGDPGEPLSVLTTERTPSGMALAGQWGHSVTQIIPVFVTDCLLPLHCSAKSEDNSETAVKVLSITL